MALTAVRLHTIPGVPSRAMRKIRRLGFRDEFERPNSDTTMGSTIDGKPWIAARGVWGIENGAAKLVSNSASGTPITYVEAYTADGVLEATWTVRDGGDVASGLIFRFVDLNNHLFVNSSGSGKLRLWRRVAGQAAEITTATAGGTISAGSTVRVVLSAASIKVYLDGVLVIDVPSETTFATATKHGLSINTGYASRITRATFTPS